LLNEIYVSVNCEPNVYISCTNVIGFVLLYENVKHFSNMEVARLTGIYLCANIFVNSAGPYLSGNRCNPELGI